MNTELVKQTIKLTHVEHRRHPTGNGDQYLFRFKNNYGASVVRFCAGEFTIGRKYGSYGINENKWELAVIWFPVADSQDFEIVYDTPITDDVMGYLSEPEVLETLKQIAALPGRP